MLKTILLVKNTDNIPTFNAVSVLTLLVCVIRNIPASMEILLQTVKGHIKKL